MARPWNLVEDRLKETLGAMAEGTRKAIIATPANQLPAVPVQQGNQGGVVYAVAARINDAGGTQQSTGQYQQATGIHAEIQAIDLLIFNLNGAAIPQNLVLLCSDNPCKRCAAIISAFRTTYTWTHRAVGQSYHSNYPGAYFLPDNVLDVVITKLTNLHVLLTNEPVKYRENIRSAISGWG